MTSDESTEKKKTENGHDKEPPCARKSDGLRYQITMGLLANISVLGPAMGVGYSAVALPAMTATGSSIAIDADQASWIASAAAITTPLGCVLSSIAMRRGRKRTLLLTSGISLIGWLVIYAAATYEQILLGRAFSGVATGLASTVATVYSAEISVPKLRATMVTWTSVGIAIGILTVYTMGYFFQENWRAVALSCAIFPLVSMLLTATSLPESPLWLREHGKHEKAHKTMGKFRGIYINERDCDGNEQQQQQHHQHHHHQQQQQQHQQQHRQIALSKINTEFPPARRWATGGSGSGSISWSGLLQRQSVEPFLLMAVYFTAQQWSGIFVVIYYAVDIIIEAGITGVDAHLGAILIGAVRLVSALLVAWLSPRLGRRKPSLVSGTLMTFFMVGLSVYLYLRRDGYEVPDSGFVPIVCILGYIFVSTFGFLTVPFALLGEIYPAEYKDLLSGATSCLAYVISFVAIKTYPNLLILLGRPGLFLLYAAVSFFGTLFLWMRLPETKGKTLREIEEMFVSRKSGGDGSHVATKERIVVVSDSSNGVNV